MHGMSGYSWCSIVPATRRWASTEWVFSGWSGVQMRRPFSMANCPNDANASIGIQRPTCRHHSMLASQDCPPSTKALCADASLLAAPSNVRHDDLLRIGIDLVKVELDDALGVHRALLCGHHRARMQRIVNGSGSIILLRHIL